MAVDSATIESSKAEIVLVGRFLPDEVHPSKLAEVKALAESEAQLAKIVQLLKTQLVEFSLDWASVQASTQRLVFVSSQAPYVRIADLALKIVREAMKSPVVTMLGINRHFVFKFASASSRDAFGTRLAPPEAWGDWGKSVRKEMDTYSLESQKHGGLMSIAMRQAGLDDREGGWIDATISATSVGDSPLGAVLRINDHYQCSEDADPKTLSSDGHAASRTSRLLDRLFSNFDSSVERSDAIANGLVRQ